MSDHEPPTLTDEQRALWERYLIYIRNDGSDGSPKLDEAFVAVSARLAWLEAQHTTLTRKRDEWKVKALLQARETENALGAARVAYDLLEEVKADRDATAGELAVVRDCLVDVSILLSDRISNDGCSCEGERCEYCLARDALAVADKLTRPTAAPPATAKE